MGLHRAQTIPDQWRFPGVNECAMTDYPNLVDVMFEFFDNILLLNMFDVFSICKSTLFYFHVYWYR